MTPNDINQIIAKDYLEFNNAKYEGEPLPKDIMERFKKALFFSTPEQHGKSAETLIKVKDKKIKELSNFDVGFILNTVKSVRFCDMYKDLDEALVKTKEIQLLVVSYNVMVKGITDGIELKKNNLLALSGNGNGKMKIIKADA